MLKQVIVVREDLKMSPGKMAAQVAHASLGAYRNAKKSNIIMWRLSGEKKVVVMCKDLEELKEIMKKAKAQRINTYLVQDAGLTELPKGTITCLGLGPVKEEIINKVTGHLKLLK